MNSLKFQRDALITKIFNEAKKDKNILFLSADFGAPSLDKFREELPEQFIHTGISEQNTIDLASGLALDGRKVFAYAMAPFIVMRCLEQHKCAISMMDLNVCTIVAGIGLGYADAGPTHYLTEDLGVIKSLINSRIVTASDSKVAEKLAFDFLKNPSFNFIRLDRHACVDLKDEVKDEEIDNGFRFLKKNNSKICIISHGSLINKAKESLKLVNQDVDLIDLIRLKPISNNLHKYLREYDLIYVVDEQSNTNGLFSSVHEFLYFNNDYKKVIPINLPEKYIFENGGRDHLLEINGLGPQGIANTINNFKG